MLLLWPPDEVSYPNPFLLFLEYRCFDELWILTLVVRASIDYESQLTSLEAFIGGNALVRDLYEWFDTTWDFVD
jgi:hypothetical protein